MVRSTTKSERNVRETTEYFTLPGECHPECNGVFIGQSQICESKVIHFSD